jgi:hypothetical protein
MKVLVLALMAAPLFTANQSSAPHAVIAESRIDPLLDSANVPLNSEVMLSLDPGVVFKRNQNAFTLSSHDGRRIELMVGSQITSFSSPMSMRLEGNTLLLDSGKQISASSLIARRAQDDTDNNLKSMQESAKKLKAKNTNQDTKQAANKKGHLRFLYNNGSSMGTAEAFNTPALQQLTHLSAVGF